MKILFAYDGSGSSESALDDLVRAGLPADAEALVVSVAEVWLPASDGNAIAQTEPASSTQKSGPPHGKAAREAATLANHAHRRIQSMFPEWRISSESTCGSPAWEILIKAGQFDPDLIVLGSHGRSAIGRFFLGSISQKVLTEAQCSVRVARGRIEIDPTPMRIIIGFDGSDGAEAAVDAVAARSWPEHTEIRLVAALNEVTPTTIGRFIPPVATAVREVNRSESERVEKLAGDALLRLRAKHISASLQLTAGNPRNVLVEEAAQWNADCVFVGATASGSRIERFLLGSTSAAVAARSQCSVEIVRSHAIK